MANHKKLPFKFFDTRDTSVTIYHMVDNIINVFDIQQFGSIESPIVRSVFPICGVTFL